MIRGKFRAVADIIESPSTIVHDIKTTDADSVSPVFVLVYASNDVLGVACVLFGVSQMWIRPDSRWMDLHRIGWT